MQPISGLSQKTCANYFFQPFFTYIYFLFSIFQVIPSIFKPIQISLPGAVIASLLIGGALVGFQDPAQAIIPAYTTIKSLGGHLDQVPASFGFYFDTDKDVTIDALGFSSQPGWPAGSTPYTVSLWSFVNSGNTIDDYTLIDSRTFTPGLPSYYFQDGYFWQNIPLVTLLDSTTGDPSNEKGFVIGAIGDFSDLPGNVEFEGGSATFLPGFVNNDNGYNYGSDNPLASDYDPLWPIPAYPPTIPLGKNAYFNPNLSVVPGPLPVLGAAAGFSWSRRLRKRIRDSK